MKPIAVLQHAVQIKDKRNHLMTQHPCRVTAFRAAALAVFVCLLGFGQSASFAEVPQRPNIVLIFADDLGWQETGFTGDHHLLCA